MQFRGPQAMPRVRHLHVSRRRQGSRFRREFSTSYSFLLPITLFYTKVNKFYDTVAVFGNKSLVVPFLAYKRPCFISIFDYLYDDLGDPAVNTVDAISGCTGFNS